MDLNDKPSFLGSNKEVEGFGNFSKMNNELIQYYAPTYPGYVRRMVYYKILQYQYYSSKGSALMPFVASQLREETREASYHHWFRRGSTVASDLGIILPGDISDSVFNEVFGDRVYEAEGFIPDSSSNVVDVGAQFGDFSILCAKVHNAKRVDSFEPLSRNTRVFKELMELNGISNVYLHEVGLSHISGREELNYDGHMLSTSNNGKNSQMIEFGRLDDFNLKCDLLKIDVEGFELGVLKGGENTIIENHPRIVMEVHSRKLRDISLKYLMGLGYSLVKTDRFTFFNGNIGNIFLEPKN